MKIKHWLLFGVIISSMDVNAQQKSNAFLKVGDYLPDMQLQMENYHSPTAKLSDFKGKLLILDFWGTWCTPCVAALPELERLQNEWLPDRPRRSSGSAACGADGAQSGNR